MGYYDQALEHHGIKGQKWGVRRFQNTDGTLTSAGKKHKLQTSDVYNAKKNAKTINDRFEANRKYNEKYKENLREVNLNSRYTSKGNQSKREYVAHLMTKYKDMSYEDAVRKMNKQAYTRGALLVGGALAVYGGYKFNKIATEGLSKSYASKAEDAFYKGLKYGEKGKKTFDFVNKNADNMSSEQIKKFLDAGNIMGDAAKKYLDYGKELKDLSSNKKYPIKDQVKYIRSNKNVVKKAFKDDYNATMDELINLLATPDERLFKRVAKEMGLDV